jgi:hypothetical protein
MEFLIMEPIMLYTRNITKCTGMRHMQLFIMLLCITLQSTIHLCTMHLYTMHLYTMLLYIMLQSTMLHLYTIQLFIMNLL